VGYPDGALASNLYWAFGGGAYIAFCPDGNLLASGGDDLEIKIWKMPN